MKNEITAKRLSDALAIKNMKPQDLAQASGVSKASISQYLHGTYVPSEANSNRMAAVLGVSPLWLKGYDVQMLPESSAQSALVLSDEEASLIENFRKIPEGSRKVIRMMVEVAAQNAIKTL